MFAHVIVEDVMVLTPVQSKQPAFRAFCSHHPGASLIPGWRSDDSHLPMNSTMPFFDALMEASRHNMLKHRPEPLTDEFPL